MLIGLELVFDLAKDFLCKRLRGRENGNRYFRVANNLLNGASHSNDTGFPMPPRPEIDVTVRFRFHLPAAREQPRMQHVLAQQKAREQVVPVIAGKQSLRLQSLSSLVLCLWIASSQFVVDAVSLLKLDIETDRFFEVEEP